MTARLLDGVALAGAVRGALASRIDVLRRQAHRAPGLAVILVGDDVASAVYVRNKVAACESVGIRSVVQRFPTALTETALLAEIARLNDDAAVDGILVQMPLPRQIDPARVIEAIAIEKDVDGFHLLSGGALLAGRMGADTIGFRPCTPAGAMRMIEEAGIAIAGSRAVVVGRSNTVGKPMALMLLAKDATVTICHSATADLPTITRTADILVAAVGRAATITADMVKPGAAVVDVGINRNAAGKLVGDVDFEAVRNVASWITPVPGGVGPMTVAMLLENTVIAAERAALRFTRP